jgi:hypothetical protein
VLSAWPIFGHGRNQLPFEKAKPAQRILGKAFWHGIGLAQLRLSSRSSSALPSAKHSGFQADATICMPVTKPTYHSSTIPTVSRRTFRS